DSSMEREAALLSVENGENIRVSLQGGDQLRAQNGLKMYEGDVVSTQYGGNATLVFFDGTRIRLDEGSSLEINENNNVSQGTSSISVSIDQGRAWVETAPSSIFTGSITRFVDLEVASVTLPSGTHGLLSRDTIFFTHTSGIG